MDNHLEKWQDSKKNAMAGIDFISSIILIMLSVGVFLWSLKMPRPGGWSSAPGLLPLFLSASLFPMALGLLIPSIRNRGFPELIARSRRFLSKHSPNYTKITRSTWIILLTGFYVFVLLGRMPFEFSSFVYLVSAFYVFWRKLGWLRIILISSMVPTAISFVFRVVCVVFMPGDSIFDWLLDYLG